jgi:hypothetical protein
MYIEPHKCPNCCGTGKLAKGGTHTTTLTMYETCVSCKGTGILWEPANIVNKMDFPIQPLIPSPPEYPTYPLPPSFVPNEIGLTFPKDFEFPEDIKSKSKEDLIKMLKDWIKNLEEK